MEGVFGSGHKGVEIDAFLLAEMPHVADEVAELGSVILAAGGHTTARIGADHGAEGA